MNQEPQKGVRGFELDMHVAFTRPLTAAEAEAALLPFEELTVVLYQPHPNAMPSGVAVGTGIPSARITGPLPEALALRELLTQLLRGEVKYIEIGVRGFLRSASGQTEWMPWRKNVVLSRADVEKIAFQQGVKYILEAGVSG